jgi:hypothetical protein
MISTSNTLPLFFTEWVGNGVREWMDANKVKCIPKVRVAEVEVDIVCAFYGISSEISKFIQRLAFSKHLPFTIPHTIYDLYKLPDYHHHTSGRHQCYPIKLRVFHRAGADVDDYLYSIVNGGPITELQITFDRDCGFGRFLSICRAYQHLYERGYTLHNGKYKNEADRHFHSLFGIYENRPRIFTGKWDRYCRGFKGIKNRQNWMYGSQLVKCTQKVANIRSFTSNDRLAGHIIGGLYVSSIMKNTQRVDPRTGCQQGAFHRQGSGDGRRDELRHLPLRFYLQ